MVNQDQITEKILARLSKELLTTNKTVHLLNNPKDYPKELIEKLSIETALKYWNGEIGFDDGDRIMNNLCGSCIHNETDFVNYEFPTTAWECFLAFDAGEFYRQEDDKSVDPSEKYTKPLIAEFLRKRNLIP